MIYLRSPGNQMLQNPWFKWLLSLGILAVLFYSLDVEQFFSQFSQLSGSALLMALAFALLAIIGSAWRWHYTAGQLHLALSLRQAISDYFLATLINQTIPGGVPGDITRAVRHGHRLASQQDRWGPAFRAVVIERLSGQLILPPMLLVLWLVTPTGHALFKAFGSTVLTLSVALLGVAVIIGLWLRLGSRRQSWHQDLQQTLGSFPGNLIHMVSSAAVLSCFLAAFVLAARALAIDTPSSVMLPLIPLILLAMLIPVSVSGWGVREGVAAVLWPLAGLPAEQGVAISVTYGIVMFLSSLPGLIPLLYGPLKSISKSVS